MVWASYDGDDLTDFDPFKTLEAKLCARKALQPEMLDEM